MQIKNAKFVISAPSISKCPDDDKPEFAFIGRSNVGKSSLINMLCNHKGLAKTSATPGKTLLINHFIVNSAASEKQQKDDQWYIVDLPGYGFAKRSKKQIDEINAMINNYILHREQLVNTFLLIDVRLEPQKVDRQFMDWLGENGIPFSIVFTKADKLGIPKARANAKKYMQTLLDVWEELPPYFITSSEKQQGKDELLQYIQDCL